MKTSIEEYELEQRAVYSIEILPEDLEAIESSTSFERYLVHNFHKLNNEYRKSLSFKNKLIICIMFLYPHSQNDIRRCIRQVRITINHLKLFLEKSKNI